MTKKIETQKEVKTKRMKKKLIKKKEQQTLLDGWMSEYIECKQQINV